MDPITIFIVATLMMVANGFVLALMRNDFPVALRTSTGTWGAATLLLAGSAMLYAVQYRLPLGLSSPLANGLVLIGCTGYWRALRQFYGLPDRPWMLVPALIGIGGIAWFAIARPHTGARVLILSSACAFLLLASLTVLLSQKSQAGARSRRVMAGLFGAVAAFTVFRAAYFLLKGLSPSFDVTGDGAWINMASPMITAILPVVGTTGFLLMCSQRIGHQWELAASSDYLTGLANRRTLVAVGEQRFARAQSDGGGFALALIDIDHFKSINDVHGHGVGDIALRHVAHQLQSACRHTDFVARHGGEEFVILWDGMDGEGARAAGDSLRRLLAEHPLEVQGMPLPVTISVGIAVHTERDTTFDQMLHRADQALYAAKTGGRDRVEVAA